MTMLDLRRRDERLRLRGACTVLTSRALRLRRRRFGAADAFRALRLR